MNMGKLLILDHADSDLFAVLQIHPCAFDTIRKREASCCWNRMNAGRVANRHERAAKKDERPSKKQGEGTSYFKKF